MSWQTKKVLYIDLDKKEVGVKSHPDVGDYIGGLGLAAKLMLDFEGSSPIIFSVGPLTGFFPFASKTSVLINDNGKLIDSYIGGALASRIKFTGLDAVVISGVSKTPTILDIMDEKVTFREPSTDIGSIGLPGKRTILDFDEERVVLDGYFESPDNILHKIFVQKNIKALVVTGSKTFEIKDKERYDEAYTNLLGRVGEMSVEKAGNASCFGCPLGCEKSKIGELGGNVLVHSLVGCAFSEKIFSDENTVFSCLNVLGYGYTHEDIENFPKLVYDVLDKLEKKLNE